MANRHLILLCNERREVGGGGLSLEVGTLFTGRFPAIHGADFDVLICFLDLGGRSAFATMAATQFRFDAHKALEKIANYSPECNDQAHELLQLQVREDALSLASL